MDANDEKEIKEKLDFYAKNSNKLIDNLNDQVQINENFNEGMKNITNHINNQQKQIETRLSYLANEIKKESETIENMQHAFQIQYDIELLRQQVRKVKENLLLSQIGLIGKDILTINEIEKYNITIQDMMFIKSSIVLYNNQIIFVLMLPNYSSEKFYRVFIEPIPNKENLEIDLENNVFLMNNKKLYENQDIVVMKKDLKHVNLKCNIFEDNTKCNFKLNKEIQIKQINNNIIITKNMPYTKIVQNCNIYETYVKGNNLIKFRNCKLTINNVTYENYVYNDNLVIPNFNNITVKNVITNFSLEELHIKSNKNREIIKNLEIRNNVYEHVTLSTIFIVITLMTTISILFVKKLNRNKTNVKFELKNFDLATNLDSSEPNLNDGRVMSQTSGFKF